MHSDRLNRRRFLKRAFGATAATWLIGARVTKSAENKPPNLLIVFPDQMRAHAMAFMGEDPVITPNLDRFASESLVLTQAVSNYPVCSPYRAMLLTGKWPHSNKVLSNCNSGSAPFGCELQTSDRCFSDVLKDRQYSTGYIGKWHLDAPYKPYVKCENNSDKFAWNEWCPPERRHGFDFWYSYGTYDYHLTPMYWTNESTRHTPVKINQWGPEHEADMAISYIRNEAGGYRKQGKPFALVVAMNPPHTPYPLVPKKYVQMYKDKTAEQLINRPNVNLKENTSGAKLARSQIKNYFAMVTGVDDQFGRILKALKDEGLDNDTIVLFTSDHGNCLGCNDVPTKNVHYEESMRIPFLVRQPGKIPSRHYDLRISTVDIYPTLLDLMGLGADVPADVEGVSHASLFLTGDGPRPRSQLYIWVPVGEPALGRRGIRTPEYTLVIAKKQGKPIEYVLHDNVNDPYQMSNIAAQRPKIVARLQKEMEQQLAANNDPWLAS